LIIVLGDLVVVLSDQKAGLNRRNNEGLFIEVFKPLRGLLHFLFVDLQALQNAFQVLVGHEDNLQGIFLETSDGDKLFALLPGDLQVGGEVLVQIPDVHVHAGKGPLNLLLGVFVVPHVVVDVQIRDLPGEVDEQLHFVVLLAGGEDLLALLEELGVDGALVQLPQHLHFLFVDD
jgi:hypothetical protein